MNVNQKDLVLLPYPFTNFEGTKVRPAIIISNNSFNKISDDCLMVPLTTVIKDEPFSIFVEQKDLASGKLLQKSRVRADKIFCVEKRLILMKIGVLNDNTFDKVKQEINKIF